MNKKIADIIDKVISERVEESRRWLEPLKEAALRSNELLAKLVADGALAWEVTENDDGAERLTLTGEGLAPIFIQKKGSFLVAYYHDGEWVPVYGHPLDSLEDALVVARMNFLDAEDAKKRKLCPFTGKMCGKEMCPLWVEEKKKKGCAFHLLAKTMSDIEGGRGTIAIVDYTNEF